MTRPSKLATAVALLAALPAHAQNVTLEAKHVARARVLDDDLGYSVFAADDRSVLGAPGHEGKGAAYVYSRDGDEWLADGVLLADDGSPGDDFGWSVGLSGDYAIVGAPEDGSIGSAYVFTRQAAGWVQQAKLLPSDGVAGDHFGSAVAIRGDYAMVGAPAAQPDGSVYVFLRSGTSWVQVDELTPSDSAASQFGFSLSLETDRVAIGDPVYGANLVGAVFTFAFNGSAWVEEQILMDPIPAPSSSFGFSVSLDGDTLVTGSPTEDTVAGVDAGAANVFTHDGTSWAHLSPLVALDVAANDEFGRSVSLSGSASLLIGTGRSDATPGAAYLFRFTGAFWAQLAKLTPETHQQNSGYSVSLSGTWAVIGAPTFSGSGSVATWRRAGFNWIRGQELVAIDTGEGDTLGSSIAAMPGLLVSGACSDDHSGLTDAGSVQVYQLDSNGYWVWDQKLMASDSTVFDLFGRSVAAAQDATVRRIVIGAPGADQTGAVYVMQSVTGGDWTEVFKRNASDASPSSGFGHSVAADDTLRFVVGAYAEDGSAPNAGAAYVFDENGAEEDKLVASDASSDDNFGFSADYFDDTVVVGSPYNDHVGGTDAGAAYVYVRGQDGEWSEQTKLVANDAEQFSSFGYSVSISMDTIVVGALHDDDSPVTIHVGAAYVFTRNGTTWTQQAKLVPGDAENHDRFGNSVAIDNDVALIGGRWDDHSGQSDAGSVRMYLRTGAVWHEMATLVGPALGNDRFGNSVALTGDGTAVVGADWEDTLGVVTSGSISVFDYEYLGAQSCFGVACPCGNDDPSAGCANSRGTGALLDASGSASVSARSLNLDASNLPFSTQGLFYMGSTVVSNAFFDGKQCALGTTFRFLDSIQNSGASGTMSYGSAIASSGGLITPGTTWHFHCWFRDPSGPCGTGSNLTNLYSLTFIP